MVDARKPNDLGAVAQAGDTRESPWLVDGGLMGELVRTFEWGRTPLGPLATWPPSLRTVIGLCLASRFPFGVAWGSACTQIYNDGYAALLGDMHPLSLGSCFRDCWNTVWSELRPRFERAWQGETSYAEDERVFLMRSGGLEEAFLTFSFSPIRDESGRIGGVFHPVAETTGKVLLARRQRILRELGVDTLRARSTLEARAMVMQTLERATLDLPFALLYSVDGSGVEATLTARTRQPDVERCAPARVPLDAPETPHSWPLGQAFRMRAPVVVTDLRERFGVIASGPYPEPPKRAVVLPISRSAGKEPSALLVAAVSPRSPWRPEYLEFFRLLARGIGASMQSALDHDEQRRRSEQLVQLDRSKSAFFANVSHEFRTPLTLMLAPLEDELAESELPLPEPRRERLEVARRSADRLLKMVNGLLDFSRVEAGKARAHVQPTDLCSLTSELVSMFRPAVERAGLELSLALDLSSDPVPVDRGMWEKIVGNLISNALKHTFDGSIAVELRRAGDMLELMVSDTGVGIAPNELPRIFERFYRVAGARARTHEGTGIGLALVRELAKAHGGDARVQSEVDRGTIFTISIPLNAHRCPADQVGHEHSETRSGVGVAPYVQEAWHWARTSDTAGRAPTSDRSPLPLPRILVAEDDADMREYIQRALGERFQVLTVGDGEAALASVTKFEPELVLSDVSMPRLDGIGLLRALRSDPRTQRLPVILLSARSGEDATVEGLDTGADDYLAKPFSVRELMARVRAHLELSRMRRAWSDHLEQSNKELEAFSYSVSHDLRAPLRAIDGFSQAVLQHHGNQLDGKGKAYLERVRAAASRMDSLIDELLELSRVTRAPLERQAVSISQLALEALDALRERDPDRRVEVSIAPELSVQADPRLARLVVDNLIDNAWKFSAKRAEASLVVGRLPGAQPPTFFVQDNGAGFDATYQHRLFQPFQRLHHERDFAGSGVGLAIVQRIVARHGGRVWAEGREGQGATFFFTWSSLENASSESHPSENRSTLASG